MTDYDRLKLDINPGQRKFHLYADIYWFLLHGNIVADVDPTSGILFAAKMDPIKLGNDLVKIVSYDDDTTGPFIHLNTNVRDLVTGKVPHNPDIPE